MVHDFTWAIDSMCNARVPVYLWLRTPEPGVLGEEEESECYLQLSRIDVFR